MRKLSVVSIRKLPKDESNLACAISSDNSTPPLNLQSWIVVVPLVSHVSVCSTIRTAFADGMIHVHRTWTCGQVGLPKSKASKGPVPLHPLLAEFMLVWKNKTMYSQDGDWVFPSTRLNGKQPRVANMLVEDHLRPAGVKAGILSSHSDNHGRLVDDDPRRFGFHNLRHSLESFLIRIRTDPKTVQTLLRHSDVKLTLQFSTHAVSRDRMAAAGKMLTAILSHAPSKNGLRAD